MSRIVLLAIGLCAGCAGPTHVVLQHPQSKEMAECKGDPWANWDVYAATESCAQGYEKAGYVRMSQY